jgi:hypothetical protein
MFPKVSLFALAATAALCAGLAGCSSSGGTGNVSPKVGPITFTGSTIVDNVMTYPCDTAETFTVSQSGFGGTFQLTVSDPNTMSLAPASGTASTTFDYTSDDYNGTTTITATGAAGTTGVLTINNNIGNCG